VWKDETRLKKELATLDEEQPCSKSLLAKRKEQSPDPTKRDASREEFGRRALAGGSMCELLSCLLTLLESFDKNNPDMGTDSVARQMHQKMVQHYWVNTVKQQVTGGGCPTPRNTLIQPMEATLNQTTFLIQAQALLGKANGEYAMQQNAEVKSIIHKHRQVAPKRMPLGARLEVNTQHGGAFCRISEECTVVDGPARGKTLDGIVFTKADLRYAGKNDDPQGGAMTILMQQVTEVMTVNQELEEASVLIKLVFRSRYTIISKRKICQNPSKVITLGSTPW